MAPLRWVLVAASYLVNSVAGLVITEDSITDRELEELCTKCLQQSGSHLIRSNAFLKWRFQETLCWPARISRIERKGHFLGFLVTRKVNLQDRSHFVLMDFILDPSISRCARLSLRLWLIRQTIQSGSDVFFTMANPFSSIARRCIGFPLIKIPEKFLPHATPVFMRAGTHGSEILESNRTIHLTLGDLDYF